MKISMKNLRNLYDEYLWQNLRNIQEISMIKIYDNRDLSIYLERIEREREITWNDNKSLEFSKG